MIAVVVLALTVASGPELTVAIEPSEVRVGDRVTAILAVEPHPDATGAPRFPEWRSTWGPAEVLASSPPVEDDGVWRQRLELTLFSPGEHVLPPVAVEVPTVGGALSARPARPPVVRVLSVLTPGQTELEPAEPPRPLPWGKPFGWTTGALAAAIAAATLLAFWRRRRAFAAAEIEALLPPLEQLRRSLAALSGQADPEAAWVGLSLALRRYLGARLGFPAAESTTSEIQRSLLRDQFPAELAGTLVQLLRVADQVKFARQLADTTNVQHHLAATLQLAERVETLLQPAAPEEAAA
jgi:hypothetical protein